MIVPSQVVVQARRISSHPSLVAQEQEGVQRLERSSFPLRGFHPQRMSAAAPRSAHHLAWRWHGRLTEGEKAAAEPARARTATVFAIMLELWDPDLAPPFRFYEPVFARKVVRNVIFRSTHRVHSDSNWRPFFVHSSRWRMMETNDGPFVGFSGHIFVVPRFPSKSGLIHKHIVKHIDGGGRHIWKERSFKGGQSVLRENTLFLLIKLVHSSVPV
jgi:hypothetical protein